MVNTPGRRESASESAQLLALEKNRKTIEVVKTALQSEWTDSKMIASVRDSALAATIENTRTQRDVTFAEMKAALKSKPYLPPTDRVQVPNTSTFRDVSLLDAYDKYANIEPSAPKDIVAEAENASFIGKSLQTYNDEVIANRIQDIPSDKIDEEQRANGLRWQSDIVAKIRAAKEANAAYGSALRDGIQALLPEKPYQNTKAVIVPSEPLLKVRRKILDPLRDLRSKLLQATGYTEETMKNSVFRDLAESNLQLLVQTGTPAAEGNIIAVLDNLIELAQSADAKSEPNPFDYNPDLYDDGPAAPKAAETPPSIAKTTTQTVKTRKGILGLFKK